MTTTRKSPGRWLAACCLLAGALAAPAAAADLDGLRQAVADLQAGAAAARAQAAGMQASRKSECERPGKIKWVQFASVPNRSFLLKVNADDGSRSVLLYRLLPDGSEACSDVRGPYAQGSAGFMALESLEREIRDASTAVAEKPWLYLVADGPSARSLETRLERD